MPPALPMGKGALERKIEEFLKRHPPPRRQGGRRRDGRATRARPTKEERRRRRKGIQIQETDDDDNDLGLASLSFHLVFSNAFEEKTILRILDSRGGVLLET